MPPPSTDYDRDPMTIDTPPRVLATLPASTNSRSICERFPPMARRGPAEYGQAFLRSLKRAVAIGTAYHLMFGTEGTWQCLGIGNVVGGQVMAYDGIVHSRMDELVSVFFADAVRMDETIDDPSSRLVAIAVNLCQHGTIHVKRQRAASNATIAFAEFSTDPVVSVLETFGIKAVCVDGCRFAPQTSGVGNSGLLFPQPASSSRASASARKDSISGESASVPKTTEGHQGLPLPPIDSQPQPQQQTQQQQASRSIHCGFCIWPPQGRGGGESDD